MDFAVWAEGMPEGTGRWVLAVDDDRLLLADEDGSLHWHLMADCRLMRAATPDTPRPVMNVNPQPQIAMPRGLSLN